MSNYRAILFNRTHFFCVSTVIPPAACAARKLLPQKIRFVTAFLGDFLSKTFIGLLDATNTQLNSPFSNTRKQGVRFPYKLSCYCYLQFP